MLLCALQVPGQNLVPNPSYEEYTLCPSNKSQIDRAVGWSSLFISPDYFNECCPTDTVDVPTNAFGHQWASDEQAYVGAGTYPVDGKEYLQARLLDPLMPGQPVHVSMRVSPGGFGILGFTSPKLASSGIGMRFSQAALDYGVYYGQFEYDQAVLHCDQILQDTSAWLTLSGMYTPDSAYQYIQLGNFFSDSLTQSSVLHPGGDVYWAYAFIDEVCVSVAPGVCNVAASVASGNSLLPPLTSTVFSAELILDLNGLEAGDHAFALYDVTGRLCWLHALPGQAGQYTVPAAHWAGGPYFLRTQSASGAARTFRLFNVSP